MSGSPAAPILPLSPAEMQVLIARAGLTPNPGQVADLVLAWRQIVALLGLIPRDRPLADDQAFVFRVPPPAAPAKPAAAPRQPPSTARKTDAPASKKVTARPGKTAAPRTGKKTAPRTGKKAAARTRKAPTPRAAKKAVTRKPIRRRR
jgi:hypothetical protein